MIVGGLILCGGESRRMGRPKAMLPFGAETMLVRVWRLLGEVVEPLVVVASASQQLPTLPADVVVVRDRAKGRGPLEGLYCGLRAIRGRADVAYVSGCDVPLLVPDFVRAMVQRLGTHDVVVPVEGRYHHPLAAVYRTSIVDVIGQLLEGNQRRMISFYEQVSTLYVPIDELKKSDPRLYSLMNINRPEDYSEALRLAGLDGSAETADQ